MLRINLTRAENRHTYHNEHSDLYKMWSLAYLTPIFPQVPLAAPVCRRCVLEPGKSLIIEISEKGALVLQDPASKHRLLKIAAFPEFLTPVLPVIREMLQEVIEWRWRMWKEQRERWASEVAWLRQFLGEVLLSEE